jgi:hypothetical protein
MGRSARTLWLALGGATALLPLPGCESAPMAEPVRARVRWVMVERRAEELFPPSAGIDPRSVWLRMEPVGGEDSRWEVAVETQGLPIELVELLPGHDVAPGEAVTARVRIPRAASGGWYRLTARPSRQKVRILGPSEVRVRGDGLADFRFTHLESGRAGITIEAVPLR